MQTFCIWRSPHGLLSCLSLSACVNGRDVRELDDLLVVLLYQRALKAEDAGVTMWMRI